MRLDLLAGNDGVKRLLRDRPLSHAYLIAGPTGAGKRTLARLMAAAMVCMGEGEPPCLSCAACRKATAGVHPDISVLGADGKDILIDPIRALRADAYIRPNEAARKVYVIENAQRMRPPSQNVLLKVLEEGPAYAAFLLLTDHPAALLPTVRSRCCRLFLSPLPQEMAVQWLRAHFPERSEADLRGAAARGEGILGRAMEALAAESSNRLDAAAIAADFRARLASADELRLFSWAVELENDRRTRDDMKAILTALLSLLREELLSPPPSPVTERAARDLTKREILFTIELTQALLRQCEFNLGAGHCAGRLAAAAWEGIYCRM